MPRSRTTKPLRPRKPIAKVEKRRGRSRVWVWLKRLVIVGVVLGLLGLGGLAGVFWYYGRDLPDVASLRSYEPPQTTRVLDRHGETIGEIFRERRTVVEMERVPRVLVLCVLLLLALLLCAAPQHRNAMDKARRHVSFTLAAALIFFGLVALQLPLDEPLSTRLPEDLASYVPAARPGTWSG